MRVEREMQPARVADHAQQPGGVVAEAGVVQDAQPSGRQVRQRRGDGAQLARDRAAERDRDRVDGEVAPREVSLEARGANVGQRAWPGITLASGACDVVCEPVDVDGRGAEPVMRANGPPQPRGDRARITLDHEVEIPRRATEQ